MFLKLLAYKIHVCRHYNYSVCEKLNYDQTFDEKDAFQNFPIS